jgi:hypothetical protein
MKHKKPAQRIEEAQTYGFRHPQTGRLIRLDIESNSGRDSCGEETCRLTTVEADGVFEVETLKEIAVVMQHDVKWYNSSRDRPMWNGLDPKQFEIVGIKRTLVYDGPEGADPIEEKRTVEPRPFPGYVGGERLRGRRLPAPLIRRYFETDLTSDEIAWAEAALVAFDERPDPADMVGRFMSPGQSYGNTGIVEALVDLPEDYLLEGTAVTRVDEGKCVMLALLNLGDVPFDMRPSSAPKP